MLLKIGSNGEDVKKLQSFLGLTPDGIFGNGTLSSVKSWQSTHGLVSDGVVGDVTWSKMFPNVSVITEPSPLPNVGGLKLEKLKGHIPDSVIAQIPETAEKFQINTPLRLAHFLSQCSHESAGFKVFQENLNYSASGLKKIFPKYFPGNLNESYAKQPQKIASRVYGGRMGNGVESTGEGYKFRGRGALQTTGKENYKKLGNFLGVDLIDNPDLVATKYQLSSAAFFFESNKLWLICDKGATSDVVTQLTKRINGGTIGLSERIKEFKEYYSLLS
jgi:putative chitinase